MAVATAVARREVTAEEAALERIRREMARRGLRSFGEYALGWWHPARVHELVCDALEDVYTYIATGGEQGTGALIVEMPPQHGKTTMVSQIFPAWLLGKRPDSRVILTAYGADLAEENSRQVRAIVTGPKFAALFGQNSTVDLPVEISDDSTSRSAWSLGEPHRGAVVAAGAGGGVTGKPAELIIIDDPFKNREEAESASERKKKLKWMTSSVLTRRRKGTAVVMFHTRWHREDLIGEMLKAMSSDPKATQWQVLSLPAYPLEREEYAASAEEQARAMMEGLYKPLADPLGRAPGSGEALWEDEFPAAVLERIKATLEASGQMADWYALYQQQPRPAEGVFFGADDFQIIEKAPEGLRWVRYVDLAISEKQTADFNASVATAMDGEGNVIFRDMIRAQGWTNFRGMLKSWMTSDLEKGTRWAIETTAFQSLAYKELLRDPELANVAMVEVKPSKDKVTRARPLQTRGKAGKIRLVRGSWNQAFILEFLDFPNGAHDDQVDTASGGLEMIASPMMIEGQVVY